MVVGCKNAFLNGIYENIIYSIALFEVEKYYFSTSSLAASDIIEPILFACPWWIEKPCNFEGDCILRSGGDIFIELLSLGLLSQLELVATKVELLLLLHGDVATTVGWLSIKREKLEKNITRFILF